MELVPEGLVDQTTKGLVDLVGLVDFGLVDFVGQTMEGQRPSPKMVHKMSGNMSSNISSNLVKIC